jgi:hypothetical protein
MSTPFTGEDGELPHLLTHISLGSTGAGQRLADAVATARNVSSVNRLLASAGELRQTLAEQTIVWVEGQHLPRAIQLAKGARGVELDL